MRIAVKHANRDVQDVNVLLQTARRICNAMPQAMSIDTFIDSHQKDEDLKFCGKLSIVRSILMAERESLLHFESAKRERGPRFELLEDTWFAAFLQLITENCQLRNLPERLSSLSMRQTLGGGFSKIIGGRPNSSLTS